MNDALQTTTIVALISSLLLILIAIVGFAIKRWISHVDALQTAMTDLRDALNSLRSEFVTITQHREDLAQLRQEANGIYGRRQTDKCPHANCPMAHLVEDDE